MRNFKINAQPGYASLEDLDLTEAPDQVEDAVIAAEAAEEQAEIAADLDTAASLEARAIGFEDLSDVVEDNVGEATQGELALTDVAQELAGAGIDGIEITDTFDGSKVPEGEEPALEHYVGTRISTEGMRQTAADIWKAIVAFIERVWDKIVALWRKIFDQVKSVTASAKKLGEAADAKAGSALKDDKKEIKLGGLAKSLLVDKKLPKSGSDVATMLRIQKELCGDILGKHAKAVIAAGDKLAGKMKLTVNDKTTASQAETFLSALNTEAANLSDTMSGYRGESLSSDKRFESKSHTVKRIAFLPQGKMLISKAAKKDAAVSVLGTSSELRSVSVSVVEAHEKAPSTSDAKFKPMTPAEVNKIVDGILDLMAVVKEFNDNSLRKLEKGSKAMRDAGKTLTGSVKDDTNREVSRIINSAAQYNTAYANWCAAPFSSISGIALSTSRSAISLGNKSLACYG